MRSHCRDRNSAAVLDPSLPLALAIGIVVSYGAWIAYSRYFARRARIDVVTALRYDALSWSALVLLWGTLLPPGIVHGSGRAAVVAVGVFALVKLAIASRFNRTVRDVT